MAELLIFFIFVLRGYTGQRGDAENHLEKWPTQNEFRDVAVTPGRSTISESAPLDLWDRGSSWRKHMSHQPPRSDDCSKAVLMTDNLQPSLKLTNWEGKERAKHKPSLAPWGLCAIIPSSQLIEVQSVTKWGLSKEVLTENETTCLGPQRTEITSGETSKLPASVATCVRHLMAWDLYQDSTQPRAVPHCRTRVQKTASGWWMLQAKVWYSLERLGSFSLDNQETSIPEVTSPLRWLNRNTEISIDSKISGYWEFLPVERTINLYPPVTGRKI